ncbi:MAG: ABC transporter ATP-binding protein [Gammaproteobacteria bacterium TMED243]|jgi:lipoprotein-releasing system ATP-binding protein|nr:lipoprotein-releasing system ATP-binding protein LolD [Gammaproteobacteria bacterium]RPG29928.1 MAG: ABC transporter ATP-binding protein [Gammaproteobacteria bacterium TMED243]
MNESTIILNAKGIEKRFAQGDASIEVLGGVDLSLAAGERVAIVGRSGSGKSSLLHVLAGLDDVNQGQIFVAGEPMAAASNDARTALRRKYMGFVYQQHHLLPEFSALENVALPLRLNGLSQTIAEQQSRKLLDRIGLGARVQHLPGELSGGERQRVAVARALIHQPKLVMADEPTGNLDTTSAAELMALMVELSESSGVAFLVVTHDPSMLHQFDRVLTLVDGKLQAVSADDDG